MTRSSLASIAHLAQEADPARSFELQREAFQKHGIVCVSLAEADTRLGWSGARQLRNIGEQLFGKRN
jgi:hypothetical protein